MDCPQEAESTEVDSKKIKFDEPKETISDEAMLIATVLQYFVTPPYLVKTIFKQKFFSNFQYAQNFPMLTRLPFMAPAADSKYREGLTVQMGKVSKPQNKKKSKPLTNTKYVNIGYQEYLELANQQVPLNVRVTVDTSTKKIVSPNEAYSDQTGVNSTYGYHVRIASKFSKVFTESSYPQGYTKTLYVSSGDYHHHVHPKLPKAEVVQGDCLLLIVSKWKELEKMFRMDKFEGVDDVKEFFDGEVSVPWGVRVEDGAMIALTKLT
jgi:predicted SPOUT superfamily RNA methylase MTH1